MSHARIALVSLSAALGCTLLLAETPDNAKPAPAETTALPPVAVSASRTAQPAGTLPFAVTLFDADDLRASPSLALDDALRTAPSFSLFRRSGSLTANPTAQGVSLRGLGPSGASRSLVLLDGIPLNDPFGGWVAWTKIPRHSIASAEILRGGGSGVWGNAALGGTVQLLTGKPAGNHVFAEGLIGDFETRAAEVSVTRSSPDNRTTVNVDIATFATDGVYLIRNPGAIDRPADLDYQRVQASLRTALTSATYLTVTARAYKEDRGNGTPLQRNASDERFISATLSSTGATTATSAGTTTTTPPAIPKSAANAVEWSATAYVQEQSFASFFSSVNAARTAETPASNQFDVPATAAGAAFTASWGELDDALTIVGTDVRWVEGETREAYRYIGTDFTRLRYAGGEQAFAGLFARHDRALTEKLRVSAGARVDYWQNRDGHLREFDSAAPTPLAPVDNHFADSDDVEFSPTLGLVFQATKTIRARTSVYQAFRVPTLNEYYRPFRVGNVTTDANPALKPETLTGGEIGLDFGRTGAKAGASLTAFINQLDDAVTNVTVVPPNTRQRRNLDRVLVQGIEASAHLQPLQTVYLETGYIFTDARVTEPGSAAPAALDGNRLPQVPRHTLTARATWNAPAAFRFNAGVRWLSAQFEDDENTLKLAPAVIVDLGVSRRFAKRWEVFIAVENLFDTEVETGRTAAGVVSIAPPRWSRAGLRYDW